MSARAAAPQAADFQDDLAVILATPPPRLLRTAGTLAALLVAALVAIAACVRTDIVVVGAGTLAADAPLAVVQPMERGVVRELRVRPGDRVRRGQVLATLDPTFTQADVDTLRRQQREAGARIARLAAELSAAPPGALEAGEDEHALQSQLYARRQQEYRLRLDGYNQALAHDAAALHAARLAAASGTASLAVAVDIADMRRSLLRSQAGSRLLYLQAEDARIQAARSLDEAAGQVAELSHALAATQAERQGYVAQWHRAALDELIAATAERARLAGDLAKALRLHDLIRLDAPQDGTVLDVAARAAGSVLQPAEPLVTILPAGTGLIAELSVPSADIGTIHQGDRVGVKVDAFPYQSHGMLRGTVRSVGQQSVRTTGAEAMHAVRVALDGGTLKATVIPGMTVSAEMHAGTRNLLGYFLYPVTRGFQQGFREP